MTNIGGGTGYGSTQKNWDPLFISATVEASNFKFGLGSCLPRNNFYDQNWQGSGLGEHPKNWDPLFISVTVEASNFKFGTQRGFGEYVTITALVPKLLLGRSWLIYRSTSKIVRTMYLYHVIAAEM